MALTRPKRVIKTHWHPNFRNPETLPDIKVVRTSLLLNTIAIAAGILVCGKFGYNEYTRFSLNRGIGQLESKISSKKVENETNLKESGEFDTLSKKHDELASFLAVSIEPSDLLMMLSEQLPREILLQNVSFTDQQIQVGKKNVNSKAINLRGSVMGDPEVATQIVTDFITTLGNLELIKANLNRIELVSLVRDPSLGLFNCVIRIELKPV